MKRLDAFCCHAGDMSDGCLLKLNCNSGVKLKMVHIFYIVDLILNPHGGFKRDS